MWRGVAVGWLLGALTFGAGMWANANWYELRAYGNAIPADEWQRLIRDGCEPISTPSTVMYYRCPRLRLH